MAKTFASGIFGRITNRLVGHDEYAGEAQRRQTIAIATPRRHYFDMRAVIIQQESEIDLRQSSDVRHPFGE